MPNSGRAGGYHLAQIGLPEVQRGPGVAVMFTSPVSARAPSNCSMYTSIPVR